MKTMKSKNGSNKDKLKHLSDKERLQIVKEELEWFNKLYKPHRKLLEAIGKL